MTQIEKTYTVVTIPAEQRINGDKQFIPTDFVELTSQEVNNLGPMNKFGKPGYERYLLFLREESYYLDISSELMQDLGLLSNEHCPYSFYVKDEVLNKRLIRGGINIDREDIIIIKPNTLLEREVQTNPIINSESDRVIDILQKTNAQLEADKEVLQQQNNGLNEEVIELQERTNDLSEEGDNKIKYVLIDTVGLCDTRLTDKGVLQRIIELSNNIKNGLNQIFFVTGGRFTREEMKAYNILSQVLFDKEVTNYTTIVRTNFPDFENEESCENDRKALRGESNELFNLLKDAKIIYVDNPPIRLSGVGRRITRQIELNKEIREEARTRLIAYLGKFKTVYQPGNLNTFKSRELMITKLNKEELQNKIINLDERIKNAESNHRYQINSLEDNYQQKINQLEEQMYQQTNLPGIVGVSFLAEAMKKLFS